MKKSNIIPKSVWASLFDESDSKVKNQPKQATVINVFSPAPDQHEFFAVAWGIDGEEGYIFDAADICQAEEIAKDHFAGGCWYGIHFYESSEKIVKSIIL